MEMTGPATMEAVAILKFDDRNRYGTNGIPATVLFGGGKRWIVTCRKATKVNQWAKVRLPAGDDVHALLGEIQATFSGVDLTTKVLKDLESRLNAFKNIAYTRGYVAAKKEMLSYIKA